MKGDAIRDDERFTFKRLTFKFDRKVNTFR